MQILRANSLKKSFGNFVAVKEVSLDLAEGECIAILGPNGAGKTTTVEMLEGLTTPDSGEISIFGKSYVQNRNEILSQTGVMLQETRLYRKFTVAETLKLFSSFYDGRTFQEEVIERLSLEGIVSKRLETLSGGQLQRVYLACALVHRPKLVFLDEPTNGLDPQSRRELWKILKEYKDRGAALILTSHFMHEAEALADKIMILDRGTCLASGKTSELIATHTRGHRLEIQYVDEGTLGKFADAFQILRDEKLEKISFQSLAYYFSDPVDFMERISLFAKPFKEKIVSFRLAQTTLEDVYLHLTGHGLREPT